MQSLTEERIDLVGSILSRPMRDNVLCCVVLLLIK